MYKFQGECQMWPLNYKIDTPGLVYAVKIGFLLMDSPVFWCVSCLNGAKMEIPQFGGGGDCEACPIT